MVGGGLSFVFIMGGSDRLIVEDLLGGGQFSCPIFVSRGGSFCGLGSLGGSRQFRIFLLSERGGVLLVKSPVQGSTV